MKNESVVYLQRQVKTPEDFMVMAHKHYAGRDVVCPQCRAKPMTPCSTGRGFRVSGSHRARIALAEEGK